jgi:hypothetical protein
VPRAAFNQLCFREELDPVAGTPVILRNQAGKPAGVLHHSGQGTAIRVAALPGITYLNDAVRDKAYDPETRLPQNYRRELRDFIAWPARLGGAARVAETNGPVCEVTRYDGKDRTLLFVIDHRAAPAPGFALKLPQAAGLRRAYTARRKRVRLQSLAGGALQIQFPLDVTDVVVLER